MKRVHEDCMNAVSPDQGAKGNIAEMMVKKDAVQHVHLGLQLAIIGVRGSFCTCLYQLSGFCVHSWEPCVPTTQSASCC